jgi:serine/threonine protein phosphatase PrpC
VVGKWEGGAGGDTMRPACPLLFCSSGLLQQHEALFPTTCSSPALPKYQASADGRLTMCAALAGLVQAINQSCPASSGTTSTVAVLKGGRLWVAGVGDSK